MMLNSALLGGLLLLAQATPAQPQQGEPTRPWTLMIYGAADNNADGPILEFLDSITTALDDDPGMEIVLFIDRSEGFSNDATTLGSNFTGARIFRLRKGSAELLDADEFFPGMSSTDEYEVDSADASNIGAFVAFSKKRFPARHYGLMIYSHANGCTMCPDEESGNDMFIPELSDEVDAGASVDFMALELCNMAGVEIAYQWRPGNGGFSSEVLVAIPGAGPPLDWARAFERIRSPGHDSPSESPRLDPARLTAAQFGQLVVDEGYRGRQATMAANARFMETHPAEAERFLRESAGCFDLTRVSELKGRIDALAGALFEGGCKDALDGLRGPVTKPAVMTYSPNDYGNRPYADLFDICQRMSLSEDLPAEVRLRASEVCEVMDAFVIASFGLPGLEGFQRGKNGIFIIFPDSPTWRSLRRWYTPFDPIRQGATKRTHYGRWAFLMDGAEPDDGVVDNWFELLDAWHDDTTDDPGGLNAYVW